MKEIERVQHIKRAFVEIITFADRREFLLRCPDCGLTAMDRSVFGAEKLLSTHECERRKEK